MLKKSWLKKLKLLDVYPKTADEVNVRSSVGAVVSILGGIVLLFLLVSEASDYLTPTKKTALTVNYNRDEKMKVVFKLLFTELPCEMINIDVTDRFGGDDIALETKSFQKMPWQGDFFKTKRELDSGSGAYLKGTSYEDLLWVRLMRKANTESGRQGCQPCHEASGRGGIRCCNNCLTLKRAYVQAGIHENEALKQPQCQSEGSEGCMLYGFLELSKVQGNFHIAVGEGHAEHGQKHHHHWPQQERKLGFNTTHYISQFSFGDPFPDMLNPLDGFSFVETGVGQQQYFLQIVSTVYEDEYGQITDTNQYSVTYQHSIIDLKAEHLELPGVFFKYDISEVKILVKEESKPFSRFVTRVCAVVGGVWVVIGLIYNAMKGIVGTVAGKRD